MNTAGCADTRPLAQWVGTVEQAVTVLTHRTRPAVGELSDPAEGAEVLAGIAAATGILPQLLDQLAGWLGSQHHAGRLRIDSDARPPDVGQAVHAAAAALAHAADCLHRASHAIDAAHQHAARLAANDGGDGGDSERSQR